jgi:ribosomal RNA assembly protein
MRLLAVFEGYMKRFISILCLSTLRITTLSHNSLSPDSVFSSCSQDPNLSQEDWSRFLPQFKKKTTSKRKKPHEVSVKKSYTPFPPAPTPSKIDLQLDSGEYFLNEHQREAKKKAEKRSAAKEKSSSKKKQRDEEFKAPNEDEINEGKKKRKNAEEVVEKDESEEDKKSAKKSKKRRI